ncbi:flagellar assembly peptidoglycan hydrolase FlgJ [Candidatus Colwellia aromaticivorans]|uniref:flagellar assembly peptidoglycan hydrolase FlgJ n=1 Tax=Candidatus Colwellia aromaticivorans TaxID=2267621 RepID=UPI000DF3794D|nr:flagellar assembly peptidoglycan hydrolase FlgJ [Candidatus Colwellia aromaticivorans]
MADNSITTTNFDQSRNFLELNGLNAIREQSRGSDSEGKKEALQEAAQQFEAIFMKMLLKSMRKAQDVLESDSPFNSQSTKFYRDMHDQQMAVELSSNGTLGLSDLIVRQLGGDDNNFTPRSVLRNDANLEQIKKAAKQDKLQSQTNNTDFTKIPFATVDDNQSKTNVNFSSPSFSEPKDFVSALIEPAKSVQEKLGVPFQVIIAQAALETGWGQKIIKDQNGSSSNNLFNIKADNRWDGASIQKESLEFEQGAMVKKSSAFRAYQSLTESVNDYVSFLSDNDRYQDALQNSSDVEHFVHSLQKAGYATDPQYANKIMATLRTVSKLIIK